MRLLLLLPLLVGTAHAHRPHTVVTSVIVDPDVETTGRAWLVMDPHDLSGLVGSTDYGAHWDYLGGLPQNSELVEGGWTDDTLVLVGLDGELYSAAGGDGEWVEDQLPLTGVQDLDLADGAALIATDTGLFLGQIADPAGFMDLLEGAGLSAASFGADDDQLIAAGDPSGNVWLSEDGGDTFTALSALPGGRRVWALAAVGGGLFAGTDDGALSWNGASWDLCGDMPVNVAGPYGVQVPALEALPDGRLLAGTGEEAVFISDDACLSWTLRQSGQDVEYGGIGDATSPNQAYTALIQIGDRMWVGGFQGLSTSFDAGETFQARKLLSEDFSKGVALSPDFPKDPTVIFAGYGGGVAWSADGGLSWTGSAVGVESAYSNDVEASADFSRSGILFYAGSNDPYRSLDGGLTWETMDVPMERVRRFLDFGRRTYVLGEDNEGGVVGRVARSADDGETWGLLGGYDEVSGGAAPRDLFMATVDGVENMYVVVDQPAGLLFSPDGGDTFTWLYAGAAEPAAGAAVWPPDAGTRLLFASASTGLALSDDGGELWRTASSPPDGVIRELAQADDGTLFAFMRAGQAWRSADGGETWEAVGEPIKPAIYAVRTAPNFAEVPALVLGTQEGVYWSWDAGDTWAVLPRYERLEAGTHYLYCTAATPAEDTAEEDEDEEDYGDCAMYEDSAHSLAGGYDLQIGDAMRFSFKGSSFRVVTEGEGSFAITVNGEDAGALSVSGAPGEGSAPGEGWKDVVLTVTAVGGSGLRVDLVEAFGEGEAMVAPDTGAGDDTAGGDSGHGDTDVGPPKDRCGCQGMTGGGGAAILGMILALRRRRALTG